VGLRLLRGWRVYLSRSYASDMIVVVCGGLTDGCARGWLSICKGRFRRKLVGLALFRVRLAIGWFYETVTMTCLG
jgi:hypothetical protein